jgi:anthranilate synthase component 1
MEKCELEPTKGRMRAVGYFSYSGIWIPYYDQDADHKGNRYMSAGAGIVADSVPEKEYEETVNKAMGMMRAVEMAETELS